MWQFRRSQILRFASYERTAIAGLVLHAVPAVAGRRAPSAAARARRSAEGEPARRLPRGPRAVPTADIVVITIDALRADHVRCLRLPARDHAEHRRASRARAPALFEKAYAQAPAHVVLGGVDADRQVLPPRVARPRAQ